MTAQPVLHARGVTKAFGGVTANDDVSLEVHEREVVGLIGPNGAGKTTLFNMLCGVAPEGQKRGPDSGRVEFLGDNITHLPAHEICSRGIGRAFQIVRIFDGMDVLGNVAAGALLRSASLAEAEERASVVVERTGLGHRARTQASDLTLADRKRLEVARALATEPQLLMLDEVMAGLTPREVHDAVDLIASVNDAGTTILLVEHVLEAVMRLCDRVVVLDRGRKIADDVPDVIIRDERVIDAYLGPPDG